LGTVGRQGNIRWANSLDSRGARHAVARIAAVQHQPGGFGGMEHHGWCRAPVDAAGVCRAGLAGGIHGPVSALAIDPTSVSRDRRRERPRVDVGAMRLA
jgi:hypothetical protein